MAPKEITKRRCSLPMNEIPRDGYADIRRPLSTTDADQTQVAFTEEYCE